MASPLRKWRQDAGLTLSDLSKLLDITEGALSRIERGETRPSGDLEARIVKRTGLSRDDIALPWLRRRKREKSKTPPEPEGAAA